MTVSVRRMPIVDNPNRLDADADVIAADFSKKTQKTPPEIIATSRRRLKAYDDIVRQRREP